MREVGLLPNGFMLYVEDNEVGGRRYWSDEIGGGVGVWDTSLVDRSTLLAAMVEEDRLVREEQHIKYLAKQDSLSSNPSSTMSKTNL